MNEFYKIIKDQLIVYYASSVILLLMYATILFLSIQKSTMTVVIVLAVILFVILLTRLIPSIKSIVVFTKIKQLEKEDPQSCLGFLVAIVQTYKNKISIIEKKGSSGTRFLRLNGYHEDQTLKLYQVFVALQTILDENLQPSNYITL